MTAVVTIKGQVTIPKELREKFDISPGSEIEFVEGYNGIQLRKVIDRQKTPVAFGCLKKELAGRSTQGLLDDLRGKVEIPPLPREKGKRV